MAVDWSNFHKGFDTPGFGVGMGLLQMAAERPAASPMRTGLLQTSLLGAQRQREMESYEAEQQRQTQAKADQEAARIKQAQTIRDQEQAARVKQSQLYAAVQSGQMSLEQAKVQSMQIEGGLAALRSATQKPERNIHNVKGIPFDLDTGQPAISLAQMRAAGVAPGQGGPAKAKIEVIGGIPYDTTTWQPVVNPATLAAHQSQLRGGGPPQVDPADFASLQNTVQKRTGSFKVQSEALQRMALFLDNPSGVSDLSAVIQFAKVLDPGSVVRPGEAEAVSAAGGWVSQIESLAQKTVQGNALTPTIRREMKDLTKKLGRLYQREYDATMNDLGKTLSKVNTGGLDLGDLAGPRIKYPQMLATNAGMGGGPGGGGTGQVLTVPPGTPRPTAARGLLGAP